MKPKRNVLLSFLLSGLLSVQAAAAGEIVWDFESGKLDPWMTVGRSTVEVPVGRRAASYVPHAVFNKQGTFYLTTLETRAGGPSDELKGCFRSPLFVLDPDRPVVSFLIGGGTAATTHGRAYAALKRRDGTVVAKWNASVPQYSFERKTVDLSGLTKPGEQLYMEVTDDISGPWCHMLFDDFRAHGTVLGHPPVTDAATLRMLTGWDDGRFGRLEQVLADYADMAPDSGEVRALAGALRRQKARFRELWSAGDRLPNAPEIAAFARDTDALEAKILKENPLLRQAPILFVTRHQYAHDHHNTHNMFPSYPGEINNGSFTPGGSLRVIDFAAGGRVTTLKESRDGVFRDPDVSYDGTRILAAFRPQRTGSSYNIVEYTLNAEKTAVVSERRLTDMATADHMDPLYLPDGRIVFTATRDPKYVMCNRHISSNIYRMEADGANIVKITNSTLFERPTDVLADGRILYDRWEYNDRDFGSAQGLWTVNADGTQQNTYYGNNTPDGAFFDARRIPGTPCVIATWGATHERAWGGLVILDRSKGVDGRAPVVRTWPAGMENAIRNPNDGPRNIDLPRTFSPKYEDPQPLDAHYFLASRSLPGKGDKTGLYLLDIYGHETLLYEDPSDRGVFDAVPLKPHPRGRTVRDRRDYTDGPGTFFVQNVYEGQRSDGIAPGEVKALRIVESMPKRFICRSEQWRGEGQQNPAANWHSFEAKRIIGEVPVYPDGSAYFEVPQDRFVYFQLLDAEGRMLRSMRSGTLVQSGEISSCVGCHENRDRLPLPGTDTAAKIPDALAAAFREEPNPDYVSAAVTPKVSPTRRVSRPDRPRRRLLDFASGTDRTVPYDSPELRTEAGPLPSMNYVTDVQPVFTKNCISCHGYERPAAGLTLVPDKTVVFNASYADLWRNRGKKAYFNGATCGAIGGGGQEFTAAKQWGSHNSVLVRKLFEDPAHARRLTDAEKRRVAAWVDLNAPYHGDYASNYGQNPGGRSPLTWAELRSIPGGLGWNLGWQERRPAPIYFDNPEKSPILKRWPVGSKTYCRVLDLIRKGRDRLAANPDVDWRGLTSVPGNPAVRIQPYRPCPMDAWRIRKCFLRDALERANRKALSEGRRRYDRDNAADGLAEWPEGWPGWPGAR